LITVYASYSMVKLATSGPQLTPLRPRQKPKPGKVRRPPLSKWQAPRRVNTARFAETFSLPTEKLLWRIGGEKGLWGVGAGPGFPSASHETSETPAQTFIVRQLKEDAILRIPFLKRHKCHINFNKSAVMMVRWLFSSLCFKFCHFVIQLHWKYQKPKLLWNYF